MAETAYDSLKNAVKNAQTNLDAAKAALDALRTNPDYLYNLSRTTDYRVIADSTGWIDSGGVFWNHQNDSTAAHNAGFATVHNYDLKIKQQQEIVDSASRTLATAQKALADYEKTSPVVADVINTEKLKQLNKKILIVGGILIALAVIGYLVWKNRKKTPVTA